MTYYAHTNKTSLDPDEDDLVDSDFEYDDESMFDDVTGSEDDFEMDFADPGGRSALRAATPDNPRDQPCPTCGEPNRLTPKDVQLGYQCNACADQDESGF